MASKINESSLKSAATSTTSHTALPAQVMPSSPTPTSHSLPRRNHMRSASLENANSFKSKNTSGLPPIMIASTPGLTGTLKCRNEQKRLRNKFGSHSNIEDCAGSQGLTKFQNIRQIFEINKGNGQSTTDLEAQNQLQSLPIMTVNLQTNTASCAGAMHPKATTPKLPSKRAQNELHAAYKQQYAAQQQQQQLQQKQQQLQQQQKHNQNFIEQQQQQQMQQQKQSEHQNHNLQQQQQLLIQLQQQHQHQQQLPRKPTPTMINAYGNRHSIAEVSERLSIVEQHQQHPQSTQPEQPKYSSSNALNTQDIDENSEQTLNLLRPIAFKPIPFEPDYSIPNRYCDTIMMTDRYGSTPSLAPVQGNSFRFGSTTDLRHGWNGACIGGNTVTGSTTNIGGGAGTVGGSAVAAYSSNNYCNSLLARRRNGSRSLKINDSMESIRHTPDSDAHSQTSTIKSRCHMNKGNINSISQQQHQPSSNRNQNLNNNHNNNSHKYKLSGSEQCDMTPSPSDSGISDLEAALKDRDSELSYLRQTMEHNEKVIFKVQKDKEAFWENETKRLKSFYEIQQREFLLKMKKMEQMLAMQQFQFKQHKLKTSEQSNKLREQLADLKNENEILRNHNVNLKNSERNLKDQVAYIEEQTRENQQSLTQIKSQLEESEWRICERNGELALLKNQLKEANIEITMKEHTILQLKQEHTNNDAQIYQSIKQQPQAAETMTTTEADLKQLNKIVILKDQVILALTNELAKLRKELSDIALTHEYGEEPSGKFTRLKQQLDNLTDICNKTRAHIIQSDEGTQQASKEKVIDDTNLEVIMNCLKIAPTLQENQETTAECNQTVQNAEHRLAKMSADIQKFVYGAQNLPDIALNVKNSQGKHNLEESTLDTLIEESANYAGEIAKLRKQLDDVRENFELEKRQWCEEREKVLNYQKQLQAHYISMYQKLRSVKSGCEV